MTQLLAGNPEVQAAYTDAGMRDLEWRRRRFLEDQRVYVDAARDEGIAIGIAEGIAIGKAEADAEIVRKMKNEGFDNAMIAELTGLSLAEIERLN